MAMAIRTRLLAEALKRTSVQIEEVTDFAGHRKERADLQKSRLGRQIFGTADRKARIEEVDITLPGRTIRALVHRPPAAGGLRPVVVNFHGGGWVQGNPEQSAWLASRVAVRTGAVVISPAYRLAPEHPFPAAIDDAWAIVQWVSDHAERLGVDGARMAVMGDSAGGNLAAVTSLLARDAGSPGLRAQVLIYPSVEMYDKYPSEVRMPEAPVLTSKNMRAFAQLYLADEYGTDDFKASPLRADSHANLAPALILTAELDPLLDHGPKYRDKLLESGVPVRYREYPGAIHGFMSLPGAVPVASLAINDIVQFLGTHLIPPRPTQQVVR